RRFAIRLIRSWFSRNRDSSTGVKRNLETSDLCYGRSPFDRSPPAFYSGPSQMQTNVLKLNPNDNVLVALTSLRKGEQIAFARDSSTLLSDIPAKHKFVTCDLQPGDEVRMYGLLVGTATQLIQRGALLSTKNIRHAAADFHMGARSAKWDAPDVSKYKDRTFLGYHRIDGQVGTRNHWLVIPLVFCENRNLGVLKQAFEEELGFALPQIYRRQVGEMARLYREGKSAELRDFEFSSRSNSKEEEPASKLFRNVDGIKFLRHESGCGCTREDGRNLAGIFAGYIHNPNVAGVTVLSLGCQHTQVSMLKEELKKRAANFSKPILVFEQQQIGEQSRMMAQAI